MTPGVVIGQFEQPDLLRLHLHTFRVHNPRTPVLVCDDCSDGFLEPRPGSVFAQIMEICDLYHADLWPNTRRFGHHRGDLTAFYKGLLWARRMQLDCLFKTSLRLIIDKPGWVERNARWFAEQGHHTAGRVWGADMFRTEGLVMLRKVWEAEPMACIKRHMMHTVATSTAEPIFHSIIFDILKGQYVEWPLMSPDKFDNQGRDDVLWWNSSTRADYKALGERVGCPYDGDPIGLSFVSSYLE